MGDGTNKTWGITDMDSKSLVAKPANRRLNLNLDFLAEFLNFPYGSNQSDEAKGQDPLYRLKRRHLFYEEFEFDSAWKDPKALGDLQNELCNALDPLIEQRSENEGEAENQKYVKRHLEMLIARINVLKLPFEWVALSADKKLTAYDVDLKTGKPISGTEEEIENPWLGYGRGILKIRETKWFVTITPVKEWSANIESLRKLLFGIIAASLENRNFSSLTRCRWCRKFFVRKDLRIRFCTPSHQRLYNRDKARGYMQERRAYDKEIGDRAQREAEERTKRRERERNLLPAFEGLLKRRNVPSRLSRQIKEWKKSRRAPEEILKSLCEKELGELETQLS